MSIGRTHRAIRPVVAIAVRASFEAQEGHFLMHTTTQEVSP